MAPPDGVRAVGEVGRGLGAPRGQEPEEVPAAAGALEVEPDPASDEEPEPVSEPEVEPEVGSVDLAPASTVELDRLPDEDEPWSFL